MRVALAALAAGAAGCGLLFDFGDFDGSRPELTSGEGGTDEGGITPARSFVLSVEPVSVNAMTGDRTQVTVRVKRGELFTEEVALAIAPGQDVVLEAPVVAKDGAESRGVVIPGGSHGVKTVTIVGTSPSGVTATTPLRLDVRGRPGTLDTSFANGGVHEESGIAFGLDVVTVDGDRIVVATKESVGGITEDAITLARFTEAGALDVTFGTGGRAQAVPPTSGTAAGTQCVARGPTPGTVLVGGTSGVKSALVVAAIDDKGKSITTFGSDGNGVISTGRADCKSLLTTSTGAIVLAATTYLQRRLPNGAADTTWGDAGEVPFDQVGETLAGALPEDGGAMRAFGLFKSWPISAGGVRGVETLHSPQLGCAVATRPAQTPDGHSVIGGTCGAAFGGGEPKPAIGLLEGSTPVKTFGAEGFVVGPVAGFGAAVVARQGVVIRVGGTSKPNRLAVAGYDGASGALLWSFEGTSTGALDEAHPYAAAVDSRGRLVIVGARELTAGTRLFLVRLWT